MTKREKVIVGIMCLTVAYGAYDLMGGSGAKPPPAARTQAAPLEEVRRFAADLSQKLAAQRLSDDRKYLIDRAAADWTRDPFLPSMAPLASQPTPARQADRAASAPPATAAAHVYSGFLHMGATTLAIIDGIEYAPGDALGTGGHYVRSISAQRVVIGMVNSPETIHLPLRESD